jgi:hypothetical protein
MLNGICEGKRKRLVGFLGRKKSRNTFLTYFLLSCFFPGTFENFVRRRMMKVKVSLVAMQIVMSF